MSAMFQVKDLEMGCPFHPRCRYAQERCSRDLPSLTAIEESEHLAACFFPKKVQVGLPS